MTSMTTDSSTARSEGICLDLGLEGNPSVRCPFPTPLHRCFASSVPARLDLEQQSTFCLSGAYLECDRRSVATRILVRHEASIVSLTGFRVWLSRLPSRTRRSLMGLAGLIVVAMLALGLQRIPSWAGMGGREGGRVIEPGAAPSPLVVAPPSTPTPGGAIPGSSPSLPAASPTAGVGVSPTSAPPSTATPLPLPSATPEPKTYVVQAGDNLWTIATDNGLTVDELMRANGLVDRGKLEVGQRLVIPAPAPNPSPTP